MPQEPRFNDQPLDWFGNERVDLALRQAVLGWILDVLNDPESEVESYSLPLANDVLAESCRVPDTEIMVVWKLASSGRLIIKLIKPLP